MPVDWFQLPGPLSFLEGLERDVRDGKSVALLRPLQVSGDLAAEVHRRVADSYVWTLWPGPRDDPWTPFYGQWESQLPARDRVTAADVYKLPGFSGRIIWVDPIPPKAEHAWWPFLEAFAAASRYEDTTSRTMFVVSGSAQQFGKGPANDLHLVTRTWDDSVSCADMSCYAYQCTAHGATCPLLRNLKACICAELAKWDRELCEQLSRLSVEQLVAPPVPELAQIGRSRQWESVKAGSPEALLWDQGVVHSQDGQPQTHSCWLALQGDTAALARRVWNAQVTVLFPHIEQERVRILEGFQRYFLPLPVAGGGKEFGSIYDLELGEMDRLLCIRGKAPQRLRRHVRTLKKIRNALAHMDVVPPEYLCPSVLKPDLSGLA